MARLEDLVCRDHDACIESDVLSFPADHKNMHMLYMVQSAIYGLLVSTISPAVSSARSEFQFLMSVSLHFAFHKLNRIELCTDSRVDTGFRPVIITKSSPCT